MEEEIREQPNSEPASALNPAEEKSVVSEDGSQNIDLGKFKNVQALLDAYNNLQVEFTKKCQLLSDLKQGKMNEENLGANKENLLDSIENHEKDIEKSEENDVCDQNEEIEKNLNSFLELNKDAAVLKDEIKSHYLDEKQNPFERAWASVVLSHVKTSDNKINDPIINQYILSDEGLKNKIIEDYLTELSSSRPPVVISSQSGERVSTVKADSPKTLAEAKEMVNKMFS